VGPFKTQIGSSLAHQLLVSDFFRSTEALQWRLQDRQTCRFLRGVAWPGQGDDMQIIGLTGGIATGKSTVAALLAEQGLPVIDADKIARDVVRKVGSCMLEGSRAFYRPKACDLHFLTAQFHAHAL
jgi:hypothetical protein